MEPMSLEASGMRRGYTEDEFRREAELRRCLNEKATQDRPLKPSTEAVHGAEAADEPKLR